MEILNSTKKENGFIITIKSSSGIEADIDVKIYSEEHIGLTIEFDVTLDQCCSIIKELQGSKEFLDLIGCNNIPKITFYFNSLWGTVWSIVSPEDTEETIKKSIEERILNPGPY